MNEKEYIRNSIVSVLSSLASMYEDDYEKSYAKKSIKIRKHLDKLDETELMKLYWKIWEEI